MSRTGQSVERARARRAGAVLISVLVGALALVLASDAWIETRIEETLSSTMGGETRVAGTRLDFLYGRLEIDGVRVGKSGAPGTFALELQRGSATFRPVSLRRGIVDLPIVDLAGLDLRLESSPGEPAIRDVIEGERPRHSDDPEGAREPGRIRVGRVRVRNATVHLAPRPGNAGNPDRGGRFELPEVVLRDPGGGDPLSLAGLVRKVIAGILEEVPASRRDGPDGPPHVVVIGPPGAGKSSQAWLLARLYDLERISTGDLLRLEVDRGSETGRRAEGYMSRGELVPDEIVLSLVEERLADLPPDRGVVFDGFPRTLPQARGLSRLLQEHRGTEKLRVVYLDVPDAVLIDRLLDRDREDDTPETIRRRIRIYEDETVPLLEHYAERGALLRVDGDQTRADVFEEIRGKLGLPSGDP